MTFREILTAAVADISSRGYTSPQQVAEWVAKLRRAARAEMMDDNQLRQHVRRALGAVYEREIVRGGIEKLNPGVGRYTRERLAPQMRAELDRAVQANVGLIKLNQEKMVTETEQRFAGWASSIPNGGSRIVDKREVKSHIAKPTAQERYLVRRCTNDQGHKFMASLSRIVAEGSGAIAGRWRSHWRRPGYDYRVDHKERDQKFYAIRGNWAIEAGLMKKGAGYTDEMTQPAEEVNCTCYYVWITDLADLPEEMLTKKGREYLAQRRAA